MIPVAFHRSSCILSRFPGRSETRRALRSGSIRRESGMGSMIGGRWGAGDETNPNLEYLFFLSLLFPPSPNLFQQLYQILTDFDIRFYMYELLKVSGIEPDSVDEETRNESGTSGAHGTLLLRGHFSCVQCRIQVS